jgi:hypothetical protein
MCSPTSRLRKYQTRPMVASLTSSDISPCIDGESLVSSRRFDSEVRKWMVWCMYSRSRKRCSFPTLCSFMKLLSCESSSRNCCTSGESAAIEQKMPMR